MTAPAPSIPRPSLRPPSRRRRLVPTSAVLLVLGLLLLWQAVGALSFLLHRQTAEDRVQALAAAQPDAGLSALAAAAPASWPNTAALRALPPLFHDPLVGDGFLLRDSPAAYPLRWGNLRGRWTVGPDGARAARSTLAIQEALALVHTGRSDLVAEASLRPDPTQPGAPGLTLRGSSIWQRLWARMGFGPKPRVELLYALGGEWTSLKATDLGEQFAGRPSYRLRLAALGSRLAVWVDDLLVLEAILPPRAHWSLKGTGAGLSQDDLGQTLFTDFTLWTLSS